MGRACRDPPPQVREVETGPHRRAVALSKGRETGDGQARVPSPQHRHSPEEVSLDPEGDRVGAVGGDTHKRGCGKTTGGRLGLSGHV